MGHETLGKSPQPEDSPALDDQSVVKAVLSLIGEENFAKLRSHGLTVISRTRYLDLRARAERDPVIRNRIRETNRKLEAASVEHQVSLVHDTRQEGPCPRQTFNIPIPTASALSPTK